MAFTYSFSVCATDSAETKRFVAEWAGSARPESVTAVRTSDVQETTIYGLSFKLTDKNGRKANRRAHYSLDKKLFFAVSGYDFRAYDFPIQYSIAYGNESLITGTITDSCGDNQEGGGGGGGGAESGQPSETDQRSEQLPDPPSVPPTPCLPPQPSASTPPVPTPCSGSYGPPSNVGGFGTR